MDPKDVPVLHVQYTKEFYFITLLQHYHYFRDASFAPFLYHHLRVCITPLGFRFQATLSIARRGPSLFPQMTYTSNRKLFQLCLCQFSTS